MSVEILEKEVVVRIPLDKYKNDSSIKKLVDELETLQVKESEYFYDVEAGSELEELLLEVKKDRRETMKPYLDSIKARLL